MVVRLSATSAERAQELDLQRVEPLAADALEQQTARSGEEQAARLEARHDGPWMMVHHFFFSVQVFRVTTSRAGPCLFSQFASSSCESGCNPHKYGQENNREGHGSVRDAALSKTSLAKYHNGTQCAFETT